MVEVSGCRNMVKEGQHVEKGELLGMFEFGGSSHALVFDRKAKLAFNT
jgi:phosphatidylserine decarboxylase